jgi:hypothetical protein
LKLGVRIALEAARRVARNNVESEMLKDGDVPSLGNCVQREPTRTKFLRTRPQEISQRLSNASLVMSGVDRQTAEMERAFYSPALDGSDDH